MNKSEWFAYANAHKDELVRLINNFHPANRQPGTQKGDFITAPNAEAACVQIRKNIKDNNEGIPSDKFLAALLIQDLLTANVILNETWFGVPESRNCWSIDGFTHAVCLMEELPEEIPNE